MLRMRELIDEARFTDTGFADDRHGLTMSARSNLLGANELIELSYAVDERRQPPRGGSLQAGSRGAGAGPLIDPDPFAEPLHRQRTQRLHLHIAFGQFLSFGGGKNRARLRDLFHARREMHGLAHAGVIRPQIAADGAQDDLARIQSNADHKRHTMRVLNLVPTPL